jgi:hypothetical protein
VAGSPGTFGAAETAGSLLSGTGNPTLPRIARVLRRRGDADRGWLRALVNEGERKRSREEAAKASAHDAISRGWRRSDRSSSLLDVNWREGRRDLRRT